MKYIDIQNIEYSLFKENQFNGRYINLDDFYTFITTKYSDKIEITGYSFLNKPIYKLRIGNGKKNVLMWTQMHGNESTGTLACLDLINFLHIENEFSRHIISELTIDILFILNPDGAEKWTRRNAIGIDINRDFIAEQSPEIKILKKQFQLKKYDLGFNLHDQRSIFHVENSTVSSTLSFLSPSVDYERNINNIRKKSMGIIAHINNKMQAILPNAISRFSDEYYPNSTGDNFQKMGIPNILFEAGHFPNDYLRKETRKYFSIALISALQYISAENNWEMNWEKYFEIPENNSRMFDILIKNIGISYNSKQCNIDIAIQYKERLNTIKNEIEFIPYIEEIGDLSIFYGLKTIDIKNQIILSNTFISIGDRAEGLFERITDYI